MKTVEEIMMAKFNTYKTSRKSFQQLAIDGAIEYANQKLDQAATIANDNDIDVDCIYDNILSLKDSIK